MTCLLTFLLASMGLTVLIVWPEHGPVATFREATLRSALSASLAGVLDCYVCLSFWMGLLLSPLWWAWFRESWCLLGCLMPPALFWIVLQFANRNS